MAPAMLDLEIRRRATCRRAESISEIEDAQNAGLPDLNAIPSATSAVVAVRAPGGEEVPGTAPLLFGRGSQFANFFVICM